MADLALSDPLIDEYLKFRFQEEYNPDTIRKLFKYIQPFAVRSSNQLMQDPAIPLQLANDPLIEIIDDCTDEELVRNTILKFMLTNKPIRVNYKILNINDFYEKLKPKYGATYLNSTDKNKAIEHIRFLLSDASWIKITDGYIATSSQWDNNKNLIKQIVPNIEIDLTIVGADKERETFALTQPQKQEIKALIPNLNEVKSSMLTSNIHDRYIETDKLKILLSSGLEHLNLSSDKDFTYVIEIN
jgi:hypothetical protein